MKANEQQLSVSARGALVPLTKNMRVTPSSVLLTMLKCDEVNITSTPYLGSLDFTDLVRGCGSVHRLDNTNWLVPRALYRCFRTIVRMRVAKGVQSFGRESTELEAYKNSS